MGEAPWWRNPQGIGAVLSIVAVALTFFFVREKRDWEQNARITALEARGEAAIIRMDVKLDKLEAMLYTLKDRVDDLEAKDRHP